MKKYLIIILILVSTTTTYSQKIGYEFRTNGTHTYQLPMLVLKLDIELIEKKIDLLTDHKLIDSDKFTLSLPLYYKVVQTKLLLISCCTIWNPNI